MGVHEPHLRTVSLGDTGDQILNVAEGSTDRGAGLARAEPGFYLQLPLPRLILDELEIQVKMLEIPTKPASRTLGLDQLGLHKYLHVVRDVHGLGGVRTIWSSFSDEGNGAEDGREKIQNQNPRGAWR